MIQLDLPLKSQVFLNSRLVFYRHDPNVLFQPLLMKILKHIWRVLSAHTGPFQGLNMITTDKINDLFKNLFRLIMTFEESE